MENGSFFEIVTEFYRATRYFLTYIVPFIVAMTNVVLFFRKKKVLEIVIDLVMAGVSVIVFSEILQNVCTSVVIDCIILGIIAIICIITTKKIKSKAIKMFLLLMKVIIYSVCSVFVIIQSIAGNINTYIAVFILMNYVLCSIRYTLNFREEYNETNSKLHICK